MINFSMARIIVVDDEPLVGRTIERALSKVGHTVLRATKREELQQHLKTGPFDLLILDLHMPDIDPEEAVSWVKAGNPAVKVLVVTGSSDVADYDFIQKPFQIDELRQKVREMLNVSNS